MTGVPLNIDFVQILLHLFNFLILFAALYFILYKPVKNFMANREKTYRDMDEKAAANLRASEDTRAEYERKLSEVEREVSEIRDRSRAEIEKTNQKRLQEAQEEASRIVSDAKAQAFREKAKIIEEAQSEISELVTDATEKLVLQATASEAFDQFLDAVEGEGRRAGHEA